MKSIHSAATAVLVLTAAMVTAAVLTGCSSGIPVNLPGTQPASGGGAAPTGSTSNGSTSNGSASSGAGPVTGDGSSAKVDCSAFVSAVAALFPQGASAPVLLTPQTCEWGVGSNAKATADTISQSFADIFSMYFTYGDDAETQYKGADGEITGGGSNLSKIDGVGKAASYYDGGTGLPQVSAWSGKVSCGAHLFISDAATVGLTTTGDTSHIVAATDEAGLAKKIADICALGWKG